MSPAPTVRLTDAEQRIVKWVAAQRTKSNREAGITDGRMGPQSAEDTDVLGFGAEFAFCKLFNLMPDFDTRTRQGTADCARFGETIDVKATAYPRGRLLALPHKGLLAAEVYALMVCAWPEFRFAGFARAADLMVPERLSNMGHGPTYALDQSALAQDQRGR